MIKYPISRETQSASLPPFLPGLPILGSALQLRKDPLAYFVQLYHRMGPIFRIKLLNRQITVLAGLDANRFLATDGDTVFGSEDLFGGFARELETQIFLVAMDGEPHKHLRKTMRRGYSRSALVPHLDQVIEIVWNSVRTWQPGQRIAVFPFFQRIVTEQLGIVIANRPPGDYFAALRLFLNYILNVKVLKIWPSFMLRHPAYKRARQRVFALADEVLAHHRTNPPVERQPNLVDDMLTATDESGQPYPEDVLRASVIGPYLAGIDTVASSMSFLLYNILKHPAVLDRVLAETHEVFANGMPTNKDFRVMTALNGAITETLRMHPVAPFTPRTALHPFEFAGYRVEQGTEVFVANGVTHYLPELYPEPEVFDVDRFTQIGGKGVSGAFAPYTLGQHLCLGAGLAESQMMVTMAALLRRVGMALESPDYTVNIRATPLPNPGRDFCIQVIEKHNTPSA